jgi:TPR repeat protein
MSILNKIREDHNSGNLESTLKLIKKLKISTDEKDKVEAYNLAKAFSKDSDIFKREIAILHIEGIGCVKNEDNGLSLLKKLATKKDNPDKESAYFLAVYYINNQKYQVKNKDLIDELLRNASNSGHVKSMFELGMLYKSGQIFKKDMIESLRWLESAANKGHTRSQLMVGNIYFSSPVDKNEPIHKDFEKAVHFLILASSSGNEKATIDLANILVKEAKNVSHSLAFKNHEASILHAALVKIN